jgi:hypothetical protein
MKRETLSASIMLIAAILILFILALPNATAQLQGPSNHLGLETPEMMSIEPNSEISVGSAEGDPDALPTIEAYGNLTYGDRTRPIRMFRPVSSDAQYKVSVSFQAPKSGVLSEVLLFWIYKSPHYAQGDGGRYVFELRSDDGTPDHAPGEEVLSRVGPLDFPFRDAWAWWPIEFNTQLEAGNWYHVIFWNVHPSPTTNYASYEYLSHENDAVPPGLDWVIWTQKLDDSSPWLRRDDPSSDIYGGMEASILLHWQDQDYWGQGYISAAADPPRPTIFGNHFAGEYFVADQDRMVERISVRISRIGNPGGSLLICLETETGEALLKATLASGSELPPFDAYDGHSKPFVSLDIEPALQLKKDTAYRLVLSSPDSDAESNSYVLGTPVYSSDNVSVGTDPPDSVLTWQGSNRGYLITSSNSGASWDMDPNMDLSFYFSSKPPSDLDEDINRDGNVDALDLQICTNVFLGFEQDPVLVIRADVNRDGTVNDIDLERLTNAILSSP